MKTRVARTAEEPWLQLLSVVVPVLFHLACLTSGHPQCIDSSPPKESTSSLTLCSRYHSSGCCSPQQEEDLLEVYRYVQHRMSPTDWDRCQGYVRDLLCAKCSPLSAHMFDSQSLSTEPRPLPGMCADYCREFYTNCSDVVWFLAPRLAARQVVLSATEFCQQATLSDASYCFSGKGDEGHRETETEQKEGSSEEGCLCLEPVTRGLANPIFARHAGDGSGRLYVGEQRGVVHVLDPVSKRREDTPFLDLSRRLILTSRFDERGMGGLAFHPRFSANGRLFVYYNAPLTARVGLSEEEARLKRRWDHVSRLSELHVRSDAGTVDPGTERVLLEVHQPFSNHNGGEMFFLDDGYLYLFLGDGGYAGDPFNLAQNKSWLLGKVLRLDVDTEDHSGRPYSIPPDNPFVGSPDPSVRPEIFAYGVRNIWRCGIDTGDPDTRRGRGRVLCGDVGQARYEEVDVLKKGANYGWRAREGFQCYDHAMCGNIGPEELPVHAYNHTVGKSVTGGQFYRGPCSPSLNGQYIYADYQSRRIFSLQEDERDGSWRNSDVTLCGSDLCTNGLTNQVEHYILSFGQDERGEVYMLTSESSHFSLTDGALYRIVDPRSDAENSGC